MPGERPRSLEIDGTDAPGFDARAIVLGGGGQEDGGRPAVDQRTPSLVWEGQVQGDGTGPQKSYFVRLYSDDTAHCQCPAFYFRGTLRHEPTYACKHVQRARLGLPSNG
jgi:hypothetical protein